MNEGFSLDDVANGLDVTGQVMSERRVLLESMNLRLGIYAISAINCILRLDYCEEQEDFLIYVEKEFMGISRATHTCITAELKRSLRCVKKRKTKKKATKESSGAEHLDEDGI